MAKDVKSVPATKSDEPIDTESTKNSTFPVGAPSGARPNTLAVSDIAVGNLLASGQVTTGVAIFVAEAISAAGATIIVLNVQATDGSPPQLAAPKSRCRVVENEKSSDSPICMPGCSSLGTLQTNVPEPSPFELIQGVYPSEAPNPAMSDVSSKSNWKYPTPIFVPSPRRTSKLSLVRW